MFLPLSISDPDPVPESNQRADTAERLLRTKAQFGDLRPLHSSIDAKLESISQSLAEKATGGGKKASKRAATEERRLPSEAAGEERSPSLESDGSNAWTPMAEATMMLEPQWECGLENFRLERYPSIDWEAL
ncbi:hypothetical protein SAY86_021544 [Trapa natans]|uniref:Uncharacterized protein n=1 Tax=Trapa natans TaxID=22666 RepID=A0AAN7MA55_TRANT|nr:hypothetical protein SAY86_021544 [Trapa natans]